MEAEISNHSIDIEIGMDFCSKMFENTLRPVEIKFPLYFCPPHVEVRCELNLQLFFYYFLSGDVFPSLSKL